MVREICVSVGTPKKPSETLDLNQINSDQGSKEIKEIRSRDQGAVKAKSIDRLRELNCSAQNLAGLYFENSSNGVTWTKSLVVTSSSRIQVLCTMTRDPAVTQIRTAYFYP